MVVTFKEPPEWDEWWVVNSSHPEGAAGHPRFKDKEHIDLFGLEKFCGALAPAGERLLRRRCSSIPNIGDRQ